MLKIPKNDIERATEIFEQEGFVNSSDIDQNLRFDILKGPEITVILGAKIPIVLPINHKPQIELASFYISLVYRPRRLEEDLSHYMIASFREIINALPPYTHDFNISKYQSQVEDLVAKYYPEEGIVGFIYSFIRNEIK